MKRKILSVALLIVLAVIAASCTDPFWGGKFSCSVFFVNNTDGDIIAEYEDVEQDSLYCLVVPPSSSASREDLEFNLGEYQGNQKDKWPPEEFVAEKMGHLTLYRMVGDTKQFLPRSCYDESSDFIRGSDNEFDIHYVKYGLYISEDMFTE